MRFSRFLWTFGITWSLLFGTVVALERRWVLVAIHVGLIAFNAQFLIRHLRRYDRHGHRRTAEDRDGAGTSSDAGPSTDAKSGITFGSLALARQGTGPGIEEAVKASVPEVAEAEPIRAWKEASIQFSGGRYALRAMHADWTHTVDATAKCLGQRLYLSQFWGSPFGDATPPPFHDAPELECRCGFYAHDTRDKCESGPGYVHLEVDLFGRIIEGEIGYRAARQRILGVHVPQRCYYCTDTPQRLVICGHQVGKATPEAASVVPVCDAHRGDQIAITTADLTALLGTEVRWSSVEVHS